MKQIRKGIDVKIKWRVRLSNPNEKLDNLTFILTDSKLNHIKLADVNVTDTDVVTGTFYGKDLRTLGEYNATLWKNWGIKGLTCVDRIRAFELVPYTPCADNTVELQDNTLWVGIQGESAYQSWLNTGHEGTEEDFINDLHAKFNLNDETKLTIDNIVEDKIIDVRQEIYDLNVKVDNIEDNDTIYDDTNIVTKLTDLSTYVDSLIIPEEVDLTNIENRLDILEAKQDADTIYDDTEVKQLISDLSTYVDSLTDNDTIYDDTEVRELISDLSTYIDNIEIPDNYDDTVLRSDVSTLETKVTDLSTYVDNIEIPDIDVSTINTSINNNSENLIELFNKSANWLDYELYIRHNLKYVGHANLIAGTNECVLAPTIFKIASPNNNFIGNGLNSNVYSYYNIPIDFTKEVSFNTIIIFAAEKLKYYNFDNFLKPIYFSSSKKFNESNILYQFDVNEYSYEVIWADNMFSGCVIAITFNQTIEFEYKPVYMMHDNGSMEITLYKTGTYNSTPVIFADKIIEENSETYDDTEIRELILELRTELENFEDNDTIYDDTELRTKLSDLSTYIDNLTDNDTIYDDTSIVNRINDLSTYVDSLIIPDEVDLTDIESRLDTLEAKEDADTIYDDTEIVSRLDELESINYDEFIKGKYLTLNSYDALTEYEDVLYFIVED